MQSALRKASKPSGTRGEAPAIRQVERRPVGEGAPDKSAGGESGVMINPLHPMHRELLARFAVPPVDRNDLRDDTERLSRPVRMAVIFHASVGAWGVTWLLFEAAKSLV